MDRREGGICSEGSVFSAGAAVQWLRDELQIINRRGDRGLSLAVDDTNGFTYRSWLGVFTGSLCPGCRLGPTRGANKSTWGCLESIAYQSMDIWISWRRTPHRHNPAKGDGGASANNFLMQFQADIRPTRHKAGEYRDHSHGGSLPAGLEVGVWKGKRYSGHLERG